AVKETFDLRRQVCRHPWAALGGSVAAGYLIGNLLQPERPGANFRAMSSSSAVDYAAPHVALTDTPAPPPKKQRGGLLGSLLEQFAPELHKVKGMAIGVTIGLLRDALKERVPQ